jgi:peroxiredoxin Q/BCP
MQAYRDQYATLFNNGRDVVVFAISVDPDTALASWARDLEFPAAFLSDADLAVGKQYGAVSTRGNLNNRNLFVVGPDGKIAYRATPFREIDPTAYTELADELKKLIPARQ